MRDEGYTRQLDRAYDASKFLGTLAATGLVLLFAALQFDLGAPLLAPVTVMVFVTTLVMCIWNVRDTVIAESQTDEELLDTILGWIKGRVIVAEAAFYLGLVLFLTQLALGLPVR